MATIKDQIKLQENKLKELKAKQRKLREVEEQKVIKANIKNLELIKLVKFDEITKKIGTKTIVGLGENKREVIITKGALTKAISRRLEYISFDEKDFS